VCQLRTEKNNRVIYIPDCGGWGTAGGSTEPVLILVEAICMSFTEDKEIMAMCDSTELKEDVCLSQKGKTILCCLTLSTNRILLSY
jgi:hypothetical protein